MAHISFLPFPISAEFASSRTFPGANTTFTVGFGTISSELSTSGYSSPFVNSSIEVERSVLMFLIIIYSAQLQKLKYSERACNL